MGLGDGSFVQSGVGCLWAVVRADAGLFMPHVHRHGCGQALVCHSSSHLMAIVQFNVLTLELVCCNIVVQEQGGYVDCTLTFVGNSLPSFWLPWLFADDWLLLLVCGLSLCGAPRPVFQQLGLFLRRSHHFACSQQSYRGCTTVERHLFTIVHACWVHV